LEARAELGNRNPYPGVEHSIERSTGAVAEPERSLELVEE
jgi:hypothetical protein